MLRAAAEATRLRMLALCAEGELTVTEITEILDMTQPAVSRHLKILTEAGLLIRFREGAWVFHRLADSGEANRLAVWLLNSTDTNEHVLRRDAERLGEVRAHRAAEAEAYFRANAKTWDAIRSLHVDEAELEARLLRLAPKTTVGDYLDIGVGAGRILELFAPFASRAAGLDISREMLALARDRIAAAGLTHCSVRHGNLYAAPFDDSQFDLITAHQVLHFLDNPAKAIFEVARLLKPGGTAILVDFAPHNLDQLRHNHAHRRLGFASSEVARWTHDAGLVLFDEDSLPGNPLTVSIWRTRKPISADHTPT
jgi:ubiquinone/menaquinone biosynthesis C-methylase UbiE